MAENFNVTYKLSKAVSPEAMEVLKNFDWPGNIRELENVIERLMISSDEEIITKRQTERAIGIPTDLSGADLSGADLSGIEGKSLEELMDEYEKNILESMLAKYNKASEVGRALNVNKSTLSRRMKKYGLE